jgi:hypothetical protein
MELLANPQIQPTLPAYSFTPFDLHASDNYEWKKMQRKEMPPDPS